MIYEVIITDQADADISDIYKYIASELLSPDNAAGQIGRLEKHIVGLEDSNDSVKECDINGSGSKCKFSYGCRT